MNFTETESGIVVPEGTRAPVPFESFEKIPRLRRGCVITEKIDGTNAQIYIPEDPTEPVLAGSRNRWITPTHDNYGWGRWVAEHAEELRAGLGPGRHYGEWWGSGIGRKYGLDHKRFSLFNSGRWGDSSTRPACCGVVPVLYAGDFSTNVVDDLIAKLNTEGSVAAPGFMKPEGIVVYHSVARQLFKVMCVNDDVPKGKSEEA